MLGKIPGPTMSNPPEARDSDDRWMSVPAEAGPCPRGVIDATRGSAYGREVISRATVVGAGVVGLAMARGLQRLGCEVTVLEKASAPRRDGAGLTLWPNAMRALDTIDAGDEVRAIGEPVRRAMILRDNGRPLTELPITELTTRHGPLFAVHRSALTQTLSEGLQDPVRHGIDVSVVDGDILVDGHRPRTELIIGADGIESTVRQCFHADVLPR